MIRSRRRFLPSLTPREELYIASRLRSETVGGSIALVAAALAVVWMNVAQDSYLDLRHLEVGPLDLEHWAADGALTIFFYLAGLELKREFVVGSLRRPADAAIPVVAAFFGVAVPAGIYLVLNAGTDNLGGWAIPSATDIAFALAVLAIVGSALPSPLRAFLLTLAVVDDFIVIIIIAIVYTASIDVTALAIAGAGLALFAVAQVRRVRTPLLYLPLAVGVWWMVHESGIHATIAGVALGLLTRVRPDRDEDGSPAERIEHRLTPWSVGVAVPFFALMAAGVSLDNGIGLADPIVLGVVVGLVVGKPVGILAGAWLVTRFTRAELDDEVGWRDLLGVAILGGVGFTVSLLVADLSFDDGRADEAKAAVLVASVLASLLGAWVLGRRNRVHRSR